MLEEEAAKLVGLDASDAAGTPTACLRLRPEERLGALDPAAPPPPPTATAMAASTITAIKELVDVELAKSDAPMKELKFSDKSGLWPGEDSRMQSAHKYDALVVAARWH